MSTKKQGHALQTFSDAGTGETFEGGKSHDFTPGAFANYLAAGLIREPGHKATEAADITAPTDTTAKR